MTPTTPPASAPPPPSLPGALQALESAVGAALRVVPADVADLRWQETPEDAQLLAVTRADRADRVVAFLHARRGQWWSRTWPLPVGPPPEPRPLVSGPVEDPPHLEIARATIAEGHRQAANPQPLAFVGVLHDALVFMPDGSPFGALWDLVRAATPPIQPLDSVPPDGMAGRPVLHGGRVAVWGDFAHAVPRDAGATLLAADERVETVILTSIDTHSAGPRETRIAHRN